MKTLDSALSIDIQQLSQDAIIELFEIDLTSMGGEIFRFTNGILNGRVVIFQDNEYFPIEFESSGWEATVSGSMPRPKLKFANLRGFLSSVVMEFNDMLGAKITRIKTYKKYLNYATEVQLSKQIIDGSDDQGWRYIGTYNFTDSGEVKFTILDGAGAIAEAIKLIPTDQEDIEFNYRLEDAPEDLTGTWVEINTDTTWEDKENWEDQNIWIDKEAKAYFSNAPKSYGKIKFTKSGVYDVYFKTSSTTPKSYLMLQVIDIQQSVGGSNHFPEEIYIVQQKTSHNRLFMEFELSSFLDFQGETAPRRKILKDYCSHTYRVWDSASEKFIYDGVTCPYTQEGTTDSYYDVKNNKKQLTEPHLDKCNKKMNGCKIRFKNDSLPGTFFPGVSKII